MTSLIALLQARAAADHGGSCYTWLDDQLRESQHLTVPELDRRARAIAVALQPFVMTGEPALLLYPPTLEFIAALFGCLYARVVAVPAYAVHGKRDLQRIAGILHDARPAVVLTTASELENTRSTLARLVPDELPILATDTIDTGAASSWIPRDAAPDDLAYLQYTSGSTSAPRGVMVSHRNVLSNLEYIAARGAFGEDARSVCWLPHFHDMGLVYGILQPLFTGFPVYLMSPAAFIRTPSLWLRAISAYRGTHCGGPNFAYDLCARRADDALRATLDLRSWRVAFNGAEPVESSTVERFSRTFASCGFAARAFYPVYGLAEATLKVTSPQPGQGAVTRAVNADALARASVDLAVSSGRSNIFVGCGSASQGTRTVIVDPETRQEAAGIGEIWVQGPGVALGYWQRATETRETFEATLASGEGPFLRTGDLGFQDGDQLYITGRLKDVILIRGKNHYPQDIERTVAACHSSLRGGAAAFAIRADQEEQLVIVAERGRQEADAAEIVQAIRQAVSNDHALQARAVVLVEQGALPRTSSGKLQRQACRAAFLTHALPAVHTSVLAESALTESTALDNDTLLTRLRSEPSPPRALLDEYVLRIVAHALHVDAGIIDSGAALTTYGLDSLAAAQLAHRIDMDLGVDIAVERVAAEMTLDQLASLIADHVAHGRRAAARPERETATDRFPASLGQAGLWFTHRTAPYSSAYNLIRALKVSGVVDLAALARACGALVERHPALRSRIVDIGGEPWQSTDVMDAAGQGALDIIDASGLSESELQARLEADANRPFDLERGPLYRFHYYDAAEPVLLLTIHHVVCDFWSFGVLIRDLIELYRAAVTDSTPVLRTGATHPAAYTRWERRVLARDESRLRAFWSRQLRGAPVGTSPFATRIESKRTGLAGHTLLFRIDPATTARLREVPSNGGGTVYATLLTAFATLVFRYSGQKDILIGSPVHRRGRHEFRDLVGHVFNTLVMRADLSGNPDFATALTRMRHTLSEGLQHGALPLPAVAQTIDMPRSPAGPGLFSLLFLFQQAQGDDETQLMPLLFGVPGVRRAAGPIGLEAQTVRRSCTAFDLTLSMAEVGDELVGAFEYDTGVFDEAAGSRLAAHFRTLLGQALANPRRRLAELSLLTPAEKRTQVLDWNATARTHGEPRLLHDLVSGQAARTPDAIALAYEDATVSYAELQRRSSSLATRLRRAGARPETLVALCADRSLELIIGLMGILESGAAYMPLDPKHPDARLQSLLQQAAPVAAIGHQHHLDRFGNWSGPKLSLDVTGEAPLAPMPFPDDCMAYVIHTSGSTGVPKGAINTHQAIGNRLIWGQQAYPVSPRDRVLHKTPLTFDVSVAEIFETLIAGATLVIATPDGHRHPDYLRHVLTREAITIAHFVPTMLRALMDAGGLTGCHALRRIVCTGEALGLDLQTRVFAETPVDFELLNFYGPTEAAVEVTTWQCTRTQQDGSVPIGTPIDNVQAYVLDANLEPCPIGCAGDLYVAGVALARGYLGRPDLTAASFVPSPFGPAAGARLYRTGDLASYQPTGVLRYLGRADAQVKLRGVRVELLEIEAVLAQHEGVAAAAVWVVNGHAGDAILRACVIPRRNDVREGELKAFLKARLPAEMIPAQFAFAERLPLLSNGKVDRNALRGMDFSWEQDTSVGTAPRNRTERHIAAICSQLLERPAADVELNLFELGCHSLLAAKLVARIRDELQVEIPLTAMFGGVATIAALAQAVDALTGKTHSAVVAHD